MTQVFADISISLDGFVAGPRQTLEKPLGEGGERLHEWAFRLASFRERHGMEGGERDADDELLAESLASEGAVVMGRRMFSGGEGPWEDDPNAGGWWGDDPPFRVPVFVLTHHARPPLMKEGGTSFTFVTEGMEAALEQARPAAVGKDVAIGGGASIVQQCLRAGVLDELQVHVAPVLLGGGVRLFEPLGTEPFALEATRVVSSPYATHIRYRIGGTS
jgi:dihydrofolate reductase